MRRRGRGASRRSRRRGSLLSWRGGGGVAVVVGASATRTHDELEVMLRVHRDAASD